jgi:hypothetical protein
MNTSLAPAIISSRPDSNRPVKLGEMSFVSIIIYFKKVPDVYYFKKFCCLWTTKSQPGTAYRDTNAEAPQIPHRPVLQTATTYDSIIVSVPYREH